MKVRFIHSAAVVLAALLLAAAYFLWWPIPAAPMAWSALAPPGYEGVYAVNTRLAGLRHIEIGSEFGPEHIVLGPDGKIYAALTRPLMSSPVRADACLAWTSMPRAG